MGDEHERTNATSMESDAYLVQFQFVFVLRSNDINRHFFYINHIAYLSKLLCNLAEYGASPCTLQIALFFLRFQALSFRWDLRCCGEGTMTWSCAAATAVGVVSKGVETQGGSNLGVLSGLLQLWFMALGLPHCFGLC